MTRHTTPRPMGLVLAGGRGTRMGGNDKALLDVAGQPLLGHCITRLLPQVAGIAINSNADPSGLARYGLPVVNDPIPGHLGPLAGLLAGMDWAARQGASSMVSVAVDTPFFPPDLVDRLLASASPSGVCIAASRHPDGQITRHPTFGLWPVALRPALDHALREGTRKLALWADLQGATLAIFEATPTDPFFNINTPQDLLAAQNRASQP